MAACSGAQSIFSEKMDPAIICTLIAAAAGEYVPFRRFRRHFTGEGKFLTTIFNIGILFFLKQKLEFRVK